MRAIAREYGLEKYWQGIDEERLMIRQCQTCFSFHHPRRVLCPTCGTASLEWIQAQGSGHIYSYSVIDHYAGSPQYRDALPFCLGFICLYEKVYFFGRLLSDDPNDIRVGAPVKVVIRGLEEGNRLPTFVVPRPLTTDVVDDEPSGGA